MWCPPSPPTPMARVPPVTVRTVPVPPGAERGPRSRHLHEDRLGDSLPSKSSRAPAPSCLQDCFCRDIAMHNASNHAAKTSLSRGESSQPRGQFGKCF